MFTLWHWCSGQILAVVWAAEMPPLLCPCWWGEVFTVFSRQAVWAGSCLWHIPGAAVVPAVCRHLNLLPWRCLAFPAGALVFKDEHMQNRHDLAWNWAQFLVKYIHRVLAFWRHGTSGFVVPTLHLQPFVSSEPFPGLDYCPSCFLISADQTLPSAHRNPSLSSSDICTS